MKKMTIIIIFILLLFGTNNYKDLNNISIITNIGIDYKNKNYKLIYQEADPIKEDNKVDNNFKYYTTTCKELNTCFKDIEEIISKEIYLGHLQNIIITKNKKNTVYKLDKYIDKDLDDFYIIYSESSINKVLKYSNNYKYLNTLINKNVTYQSIKKSRLENGSTNIPSVIIRDNVLLFYKYYKVDDKDD